MGATAVSIADVFRFTVDIKHIRCFRLHAEGQFKGANAVLKLGVVPREGLLMALVEFADEAELFQLLTGCPVPVPDMANTGFAGGDAGIADRAALVVGGEEACAPVLDASMGKGGADGDEGGKILILGAQPVGDPGSHAGPHEVVAACVQFQKGTTMCCVGAVYGVEEAKVVHMSANIWKEFANQVSALTIRLEFPW